MGLFSKDIKTMNDLFVHQLQDIYYAEKQLVKALPTMANKAADPQLKQGFLTHLEETRTHVTRLEEVFRMHGAEIKAVNCPAIDGIIEEADEVAGEVADKSVLDAALINAAQAAEHYEITRYGSLIAWAKQLGRNDCATVLQKTLEEEKATDLKLTKLAESKVNLRAASLLCAIAEPETPRGKFFARRFYANGMGGHSSTFTETFWRNGGGVCALVHEMR
jgi:ferritin-like metal-binding protein YciE